MLNYNSRNFYDKSISQAHLIGVDTLRRLPLEQLLHNFDNPRHAGHAAHQQHLKPKEVRLVPATSPH
jgi:hypothetical protein